MLSSKTVLLHLPEFWSERIEILVPAALGASLIFILYAALAPSGVAHPLDPDSVQILASLLLGILVFIWLVVPPRISVTERFGSRRRNWEFTGFGVLTFCLGLICVTPFLAGYIAAQRIRTFSTSAQLIRDYNSHAIAEAYLSPLSLIDSQSSLEALSQSSRDNSMLSGEQANVIASGNVRARRNEVIRRELLELVRINERYGETYGAKEFAEKLRPPFDLSALTESSAWGQRQSPEALMVALKAHGILQTPMYAQPRARAITCCIILNISSLIYVSRHRSRRVFLLALAVGVSSWYSNLIPAFLLGRHYVYLAYIADSSASLFIWVIFAPVLLFVLIAKGYMKRYMLWVGDAVALFLVGTPLVLLVGKSGIWLRIWLDSRGRSLYFEQANRMSDPLGLGLIVAWSGVMFLASPVIRECIIGIEARPEGK